MILNFRFQIDGSEIMQWGYDDSRMEGVMNRALFGLGKPPVAEKYELQDVTGVKLDARQPAAAFKDYPVLKMVKVS